VDIGSLYRKGLAQSHGRSVFDDDDDPPPPAAVVDGGSGGEVVGELVDVAFRELDTARRKADMTLATARTQASRVYREARRDARKLLSKARQKADRLEVIGRSRGEQARRAGYDRGLVEGRAAGRGELLREMGAALDVLVALAEDLAERQGELAAATDDRLARMLMMLLRRVVGVLDERTEGLLLRAVTPVLTSSFRNDEPVEMRVHPDDMARVDSVLADVDGKSMHAAFAGRRVSLRADASLQPGCCRLTADGGGWAVAFADRLAALERELTAALAEERFDES